jgi:putative FmdB family regulatory protein
VPIYEFRCPKGHTFEVFQRMDDPQPKACEICGASPIELVLYPVAVHYKGSGFYATDYGRGARKAAKDGDSPDSSGTPEKKDEKKDQKKEEKKPAEA